MVDFWQFLYSQKSSPTSNIIVVRIRDWELIIKIKNVERDMHWNLIEILYFMTPFFLDHIPFKESSRYIYIYIYICIIKPKSDLLLRQQRKKKPNLMIKTTNYALEFQAYFLWGRRGYLSHVDRLDLKGPNLCSTYINYHHKKKKLNVKKKKKKQWSNS